MVDGGSQDGTPEIAADQFAQVLDSRPGRGHQLNAGAKYATGEILLFLHADNWISVDAVPQLVSAFEQGHRYCCFRQQIDAKGWVYRAIELGNTWRARYQKLPYGDQGIAVSRDLFEAVGGFDEVFLMEDVLLAKKLHRLARLEILKGPIHVCPRRWQQKGPIRQTIANWWTMFRFRLGAQPEQLARDYYPQFFSERSADSSLSPDARQESLVIRPEQSESVQSDNVQSENERTAKALNE